MSSGVAGSAGINKAGRRGLKVIQAVARGECVLRIRRAGRRGALSAATQIRLDVLDRGNGGLGGFVFQRPGLFGAVNLAKVVDAGGLLGLEARAHEIWNRDGCQQSDDGHHNHDFHECKSPGSNSLDLHRRLLPDLVVSLKYNRWPDIPVEAQLVVQPS